MECDSGYFLTDETKCNGKTCHTQKTQKLISTLQIVHAILLEPLKILWSVLPMMENAAVMKMLDIMELNVISVWRVGTGLQQPVHVQVSF